MSGRTIAKEALSIHEAAACLGVNRQYIRERIASKDIEFHFLTGRPRTDRNRRLLRSEVINLLVPASVYRIAKGAA